MIKVFYGNDRVKTKQTIEKFLGLDYEIIEGSELELSDLPNIFLGNSLFDEKRNILIKDFVANKAVAEKLQDYINSPHNIVIQEASLSKNSTFYKQHQEKIEFREFKLPETSVFQQALNIYSTAKKDGPKAVALLDQIKLNYEPIPFTGMIASIAIKDFEKRQGIKEKRALFELSKIDIEMKTTSLSPWSLLSAFLLQLSSWQ